MGFDGTARGVVLAGGDSVRFGEGDKALATLDGRPLLSHVVEGISPATAGSPLLAVASESDGAPLPDVLENRVNVVVDDPAYSGPVAGLVSAARRAEAPWLFVCGCDMPLLSAETVTAVLDHASEEMDAVVPVVDGRDQHLCAVYRRETVLATASSLNGSAGLYQLLDAFETVERIRASAVDAPIATAVTNVNTRPELESLRERRTK